MTKHSLTAAIGALAALAAGTGMAQSTTAADKGWYGGISVGRSIDHTGGAGINSALANQGVGAASTLDKRDWTGSLFAGYRVNPAFSVEGGVTRLGRFDYRATSSAPTAGTISGRHSAEGVELDAVGTWPIANRWSVFGKAGLFHGRTRLEASGTGVAVSERRDWNTSPLLGVGASYAINRNWDARVEWDRYFRVGDSSTGRGDIDRYVVGVTYRFQ